MLPIKSQTRFLLRGSALLVTLLALWWFVLLNPLLSILRASAEVSMTVLLGGDSQEKVSLNPSGDWDFHVPLEATIQSAPGQGAVQIHSIDFTVARSDVIAFTFSLPVFWAILLAAPQIQRSLRPLLWGSLLTMAMELALLLVFVQITARESASQYVQGVNGHTSWFLHFGRYLVVNVIPYVAPVLIVIVMHRGLRSQIFGAEESGAVQAEPSQRGKSC